MNILIARFFRIESERQKLALEILICNEERFGAQKGSCKICSVSWLGKEKYVLRSYEDALGVGNWFRECTFSLELEILRQWVLWNWNCKGSM